MAYLGNLTVKNQQEIYNEHLRLQYAVCVSPSKRLQEYVHQHVEVNNCINLLVIATASRTYLLDELSKVQFQKCFLKKYQSFSQWLKN